jgi:hypothetical protein
MVFAPAEISKTKQSIFAVLLVLLFIGLLIFSLAPVFLSKLKPYLPKVISKRFRKWSSERHSTLAVNPLSTTVPAAATKVDDVDVVWNQNPLETTQPQVELNRISIEHNAVQK